MSTEAIAEARPVGASRRPWAARSAELESEHGAWCDYAAWQEWLRQAENIFDPINQPGPILDALDDPMHEVALYVVMCKLADGDEGAR